MDCNCNSLTNKLQPRIKHVFGNVLSIAIPLTLRTLTKNGDEMIVSDVDFIPSSDYPVSVVFTRGKTRYPITAVMDGNVAVVEDKGKMPLGMYDICVECRDDEGDPYRFKQNTVLEVCDTTAEAGIDEEIEYEAKTWYLNAAVFLATTEVGEVGDVIDAKLVDVFGDADYDATAKAIRFYNKGKTAVLATIDARPFIADATVSDMYINTITQTLYLVLDNEDGGRTFTVPLYLIFSNYYNKASVDNLLASKASSASVTALSERLTPVQVTFTRNTSGSTTTYTSDYTLAQINTNYSNHKPIVASLGSDVGVLLHSDTDYAVFEFADQYGEKYLLWCNHGTWNRIDGGGDIEIDDNPTEDSENAVSSGGVYAALSQKVSGISVNGETAQYPTDGIVSLTISGGGTGDVTGVKVGDYTYTPASGSTTVDITSAVVQPETGKGLFSGSYNDLTNKPTIPAAQVNSDWNASSGVAQILNKPTIPTVDATLGTSSQSNAVQGGAIVEALAGKEDALTWDSTPTSASTNPVTSGGVYTALQGKQDTISNLATITTNAGKGLADVSSEEDGTVVFTLANEDTYTLDLNHEHPQYLETADIDDYVTAGTNVTITKDSQTGVLEISASGGSSGVTGITMNGSDVTISNGVAALGTVITSLSGCVQSNATTGVTNIVVCTDEAAYTAITTKDSNTLYLIKESNA